MSNIITNIGKAKLAIAIATATPIEITEIALGTSDRFPTGGETELEAEVYRDLVSETGVVDGSPNQAYFKFTVPADGEEPGFNYGPWNAQEVGLFDSDGDLIVIGRFPDTLNKYDPNSGSPNALNINIRVIFENIAAINLTYIPDFNLPWASDPEFNNKNTQGRIAQVKQIWTLFSDVAIWIKADVTFDIGSNAADDFTDLNAAMTYLRYWLIADGVTVTLSMRAEVHSYNTDIIIDHPMSDRIAIVGAAMAGADPAYYDFAVTGYDAPSRAADAVTNLAFLRTRYTTEIQLNGASFNCFKGLFNVDDILFVGDGSVNIGVVLHSGNYRLGTISAHGFGDDQFHIWNSRILLSGNASATGGAMDGFEVFDSKITGLGFQIIAHGNGVIGVDLSHGTIMNEIMVSGQGNATHGLVAFNNCGVRLSSIFPSRLMKNGSHGLYADVSRIWAINPITNQNASIGIIANRGSTIYAPGAISQGNTTGVYASEGSFAYTVGGTINSNATQFTPAVNTVGNYNSYIHG